MKKTFKVIMLPTNELEGILFITHDDNTMVFSPNSKFKWKDCKYQHLYIISDEEIKEGDWVLQDNKQYPYEVVQVKHFGDYKGGDKKIIATTDKNLHQISNSVPGFNFPDKLGIPAIPKSFIQAYIKSYNEDKIIEEVNLETELDAQLAYTQKSDELIYKIKTRSDNTVIIHQSKMYSRTDIEIKIKDFLLFIKNKHPELKFPLSGVGEWIEENL